MTSYVHAFYNTEFGKEQQCKNQVPPEMEDQITGDEHLQEARKENAFSKP